MESHRKTLFVSFSQFGEYSLHEIVPFNMHVIKGAGYKDADGFPEEGHELLR